MRWVAIFAGGGLGAVLRFWLSVFVQARAGTGLPWGTLAVNALGCLAIGFLATWFEARGPGDANVRLFALVGVLGGFTTFSTFGLETWGLLAAANWAGAAANVVGSVVVGIAGVIAGVAAARAVIG